MFPSITQHCVIEEQDDHVVIALRVPKSEIADNIHFLAGLANVVPRVENHRTVHPGWRRAAKAAIAFGVLGLGMFGLPQLAPVASVASGVSPIEYRAWAPSKSLYKVGESVQIDFQYHRNRECATIVDKRLRHAGPVSDVVYSSRHFGMSTKVNNDFEQMRAVAAGHLPAGNYIYSGNTHSDCGKESFDSPHPDVAFSIIE